MAWKKNSPEVVRAGRHVWMPIGQPFEPFKGRLVKDRVTVPEAIAGNARSLRARVRRAARYARGANSGLGRRERRAR